MSCSAICALVSPLVNKHKTSYSRLVKLVGGLAVAVFYSA